MMTTDTRAMVGPLTGDPTVEHRTHRVPDDAAVDEQHGTTTHQAICGVYCAPAPAWYLDICTPCGECAAAT